MTEKCKAKIFIGTEAKVTISTEGGSREWMEAGTGSIRIWQRGLIRDTTSLVGFIKHKNPT